MALETYSTHFCGIGGACYGIEQAGLHCVTAIDYLDYAVETRLKNLGHQAMLMDISEYEPKKEDYADVLWTSPSCQSFSQSARESANINKNDIRNNLFLASVNYVNILRPKYVVLENVMGLITHNADENGGGTLNDMKNSFLRLGYHVEWNTLNSLHFGLPQKRERVFIIASRDGKSGLVPKEPKQDRTPCIGDIMEHNAEKYAWGSETYITAYNKVTRIAMKNGEFGIDILTEKDVFPTITCGWGGGATRKKVAILDETKKGTAFLRHPTPLEGARAQGFPDSWIYPKSNSDKWTLIGNAVSSSVSKAIVEHLKLVEDGKNPANKTEFVGRIPKYAKSTGVQKGIEWE